MKLLSIFFYFNATEQSSIPRRCFPTNCWMPGLIPILPVWTAWEQLRTQSSYRCRSIRSRLTWALFWVCTCTFGLTGTGFIGASVLAWVIAAEVADVCGLECKVEVELACAWEVVGRIDEEFPGAWEFVWTTEVELVDDCGLECETEVEFADDWVVECTIVVELVCGWALVRPLVVCAAD